MRVLDIQVHRVSPRRPEARRRGQEDERDQSAEKTRLRKCCSRIGVGKARRVERQSEGIDPSMKGIELDQESPLRGHELLRVEDRREEKS